MREKVMENLIMKWPELFIEKGLTLRHAQYTLINGRRPDLIFEDARGRTLLVEIQSGVLDDAHMVRMVDYYGAYKLEFPGKIARLMFIAHDIPAERMEFIRRMGFEGLVIPPAKFRDIARKKKYPLEADDEPLNPPKRPTPRQLPESPELDVVDYSKLPNKPLFADNSPSIILGRFNDYMKKHVLAQKKRLSIRQHSAWILAHKAGLHIGFKEDGLKNSDTQAYFKDQPYLKLEKHMSVFYKQLMKQPETCLKDIRVTLSGKRNRRVLTFELRE